MKRIGSRSAGAAAAFIAAAWIGATPSYASFHLANITEIMTSYGGDPNVQFVEMTMITVGEQFVAGTKLNAFDASGNFIATVLTVPSNVASGAGRPWIMGTPAFETASGIQADFEFPNASLPVAGGMVCWGKPSTPTPVNCPSSGIPYVDCIAYGNYAGPNFTCIGAPNPVSPEGRSLRRITSSGNNLNDFVCSNPAEPENNTPEVALMPATSPCPNCGNDITEGGEACDGTDDAACPDACLANCQCAVCGDGDVNAPGEECDGVDDGACPGECANTCVCAVCGNSIAEPPVEECDQTDDAACPGLCGAPAGPDECECPPGPLDNYICYKTSYKRAVTPTLSDDFDTGVYEGKVMKRFCLPADKNAGGITDTVTHLTVETIKGPHVKQPAVRVLVGTDEFFFDTKKASTLMVPATRSFSGAPPPALDPDVDVDHYRCLKVVHTKDTATLPKGTIVTIEDDLGLRQVEIKKPSTLCLPTDKNGEGIKRPDDHLLCYKAKSLIKQTHDNVRVLDQFGQPIINLKGEAELCVPALRPPPATTTTLP